MVGSILILYHSIKAFNHNKSLPVRKFVSYTAAWPVWFTYFMLIGCYELIRDMSPPKPRGRMRRNPSKKNGNPPLVENFKIKRK